jgi:hypothetical protein
MKLEKNDVPEDAGLSIGRGIVPDEARQRRIGTSTTSLGGTDGAHVLQSNIYSSILFRLRSGSGP